MIKKEEVDMSKMFNKLSRPLLKIDKKYSKKDSLVHDSNIHEVIYRESNRNILATVSVGIIFFIKCMNLSKLKVVYYYFFKNKRFVQKEWENNEYFDEIWKVRIEKLSKYIDKTDKKVCDLGCGKQWLKNFISKDVEYIPVDYKKRSADTIVYDFNKHTGLKQDILSDVVFCSGIIEYIEDTDKFVNMFKDTKKIIISYCTLETHPNLIVRKKLAWKNNFTLREFIVLFLDRNFVLEKISIVNNNMLFCFKKSNSGK